MTDWKILRLQPQNFRNLNPVVYDFVPGINCIFGKNGNGKTNLLEAIHLLTNRKSFRKNTGFSQMINIDGGEAQFILQSVFTSNDEKIAYSLRASDDAEERFFNNEAVKTKTPGTSIFINPFDSYVFHTSASFRRQWMDTHIGLLDKEYKQVLGKFQKSLRFRNSVLGMGGKNTSLQLRAIDQQVSEYSAILTQKRLEHLEQLNQFITKTFKAIFAEEHSLKMDLESQFSFWNAQKIYDFYRHQEIIDIRAEMTQVGIHRDDFIFSFDGLNAFEFCSLGQQKMAFLSLIFAYIELFRYKFSSYPLVLIDDVSGELDSQRWKNLIEYLETKKFQVLITTANENFGKELELIPNSKKFTIEHGMLISPG